MTTQRVALPWFGPDPLPWQRPPLATFSTWLNKNNGLADATAVDGANGKPLVIRGSTRGDSYLTTGLLKPAPTPPWTITVALAAHGSDADVIALPIILQSTDLKLGSIYWQSTGTVWFDTLDDGNLGTQPNADLDAQDMGFPFRDYFGWFKAVHDGSALSFFFSPEGQDWDQLNLSGSALSFLGDVAKVGFGVDRIGNAIGSARYAKLWSWVES